MAGGTKKGQGRKKKAKTTGKSETSSFGRVALAVALVAIIALVGGIAVVKMLPPAVATRKHATIEKKGVEPIPPRYEVYDDHAVSTPVRRPVAPRPKKPRLALIIDDIGYKKRVALDLLNLDPHITFAILPNSPFGKSFAAKASQKGAELMLHQPMEPMQYPKINPGPGALLAGMDPDTLINTLEANLRAFPSVRGMNNHMGSRLTSLSPQMNQVMTLLKQKGLYFIDSRTSKETVSKSSARLLQVPFAERDIFLDHNQSRGAVARQVEKMLAMAEKHGVVIGIGHPHDVTLEVLAEMMPEIHRRVRLVRPSTLVAIP